MNKLLVIAHLAISIMLLLLSCNKHDEQCIASQNPSCACTKQYDPVCGCDGIAYGNSCMAECAGITDYVPGECSQ